MEILKANGIEPTIIEYLKTAPDLKTINQLLSYLDKSVDAILRSKEDLYSELKMGQQSEEEKRRLLSTHPQLMERPIVVRNQKAVIGRPPENVHELMDK